MQFPLVLKAQLKAGGRGKAGAIKIVHNPERLDEEVDALFGRVFFRQKPEYLLIEEFVPHEQEFYLSCLIMRKTKCYALMLSAYGGVEIESNAEKVSIVLIDPLVGLMPHHIRDLMFQARIDLSLKNAIAEAAKAIYHMLVETDAQIVEINPLVIVGDKCVALDGKVIVDDSSISRHYEFAQKEKCTQAIVGSIASSPFAETMKQLEINVQEQDGDIALITGGAGRMMATLDLLSSMGGTFRVFGELGVIVFQPEKLSANIKVLVPAMLKLRPKAILLSICWVLANCEEFAKALADTLDEVDLAGIPMIVRICGNKQEEAHRIMFRYTDRIVLETELVDACQAVIKAVGGVYSVRNC